MFDQKTYIRRRNELKQLVNDGIIILFGNNESPMNYPANAYIPIDRIRHSYIISVSTAKASWV